MANYNKSFNFRNGVQVDDDNFVVNPNGLVGIGTSIPREFLDVYGTAKITGLVTTTNLSVTGISTFYNDVKVGSAITLSPSTGAVSATTFYGSAAGLTGVYAIAVGGWFVNSSNSTISTSFSVGLGTTNPQYSLQVGQNPSTANGFSVDAISANIKTTGIATAYSFSGFGTDIQGINASNITNGTLNTARLPSNVNISGIATAYSFSGFGTDIQGINASNITNGTLNTARLPSNVNIGGSITATSGIITSLETTNINNIGIATLGIGTASQLYVSGVTTSVNGFSGNLSGNVNSTGLSTFSGGIQGNVIGIASTAYSLIGTPNIIVGIVTATTINVASGGTGFSALNSGRIGVGTALPTSEFQIRKASNSLLEVISESGQASISIGQSVGVGKSTAVLRFGNSDKTFDIVNNDTGNINTILHAGPAGINTGRFDWYYGQNISSPLMSLNYDGKLGIGITNPINTLHVAGISTVRDNSYVGDTLYVKNDIYLNNLRANSVASNTYVTSGVSTFSTLYLNGGQNILGIGTNNAGGYKFKIEDNLDAYLGTKAKLGTQTGGETIYFANNLSADASLLKVFGGLYARNLYVDTWSPSSLTVGTGITASSGIVTATNGFSSGTGAAVKITVVSDRVYFTVAGLGVTSLKLF
jgi:hypothetical protein